MTTLIAQWLPSDFAEDSAQLDLGEHRRTPATIHGAIESTLGMLPWLDGTFGVTSVTFYFNGTPAYATTTSTVDQVFQDWNTRRENYQRAVGII